MMFEKSRELAETLLLSREKYMSMYWMTRCYRSLSDWDKVFEIFAEFETHGPAELESEDLAHMLQAKGYALKERRQALDAIEAFQLAETYARECGMHFMVCDDAIQRAHIHALLREYNVARDILLATLEYAREDASVPLAARVQMNLGRVYLQSGDFPAAIVTLEDAVSTLESIEDDQLNKEARLLRATAYGRNGDVARAEVLFAELDISLDPWDIEVRASIALARAIMSEDPSEVTVLHKKARALAANDGRHHFVHVVDINVAVMMAESGDLESAERLLRSVMESAEKFDDQDVINEARVRLASILVEVGRPDEALSMMSTLSIASFGDDALGWQRFALVQASALLCVGDVDEAEQSVTVIMNLDRSVSNLPMIAEAYWISSQVEEKRNGRTLRWERELSASVVMQLHAGNAELATERSRDLVPTAASGVTIPRTPLATPDALLDDITSENAE
ncbi:MAG: tetratricopeptide repeat protein [Actinobacteria bacterium]|nr:tetratricopeptide repeat protein [Actinomycetota bacterium]